MIFTTIKTAFNVARGWTVQHSPEILLGTSIAAGIGATVTGCIATKKMEAINQNHREILDRKGIGFTLIFLLLLSY